MFLRTGEVSSDSAFDCTSHDSGSHSPNHSSVPRSARYNLIIVSSVSCPGRENKNCLSKRDDDDDDFAPASAPTASDEV